jgi:hypothetical protein
LVLLRLALILAGLGAVLIGAVFLGFDIGWISQKPSFLFPTAILLFIITIVICRYLYRLRASSLFTQFYLLSMVIKLTAALAYSIIMVMEDRPGSVPNVAFFLVLYLVYTVVEIVFLYRLITAKTTS